MGDRFYEQQKKHKPKRVLKKDYIQEINVLLGQEITGLDKCTIATLTTLSDAIKEKTC
jgi:hypothetical protein